MSLTDDLATLIAEAAQIKVADGFIAGPKSERIQRIAQAIAERFEQVGSHYTGETQLGEPFSKFSHGTEPARGWEPVYRLRREAKP